MFQSFRRLGTIALACLALMSFKLGPETTGGEKLIYDVRGAFVAARPDISPDLMQSIHYQISNAIEATTRGKIRPRVVLTIRLVSVAKNSMLVGERASARVIVRAAAVQSGEVIAETKFTATVVSLDKSSIEQDLASGIAERVISEFRLNRPSPSTLATALFASPVR
ncbi:hypothetical protein G6L28_07015 [Agrobacterium larrymoorei]|nr:hypothetical protein [Agrobacterium larrymoorei]NTJ42351.1 hypothetical protein [Agrobacterium larrymoorei]